MIRFRNAGACRVLGQSRSTQRRQSVVPSDAPPAGSGTHRSGGRYSYHRMTEFLRRRGYKVNHKRVERIWKQEGLIVPVGARSDNKISRIPHGSRIGEKVILAPKYRECHDKQHGTLSCSDYLGWKSLSLFFRVAKTFSSLQFLIA